MAGRAEEIVQLYTSLRSARFNFDNTIQEIIDHIDPHHRDVTTERVPGERKNQAQFDGTSAYGSHVFAQFVEGSVFNQATKWFSLASRDPALTVKAENATWLTDTRDRMLREMRNSFYGPAGQSVMAWTLFGNAPMLIEEVPAEMRGNRTTLGRIKYTSIPWGTYVMFEGADGRIDGFIRSIKLPAHVILKRFGDVVSDDIKTAASKTPMREFEILHSILPRDFQAYSKSAIKTSKDYEFASCWVECAKKKLLKESGYRKFPVAVARYDLISGEVYARGLGEIALPDQKTLNQADQKALLKWDRELDPPMLVRRNSIIGRDLSQKAGGKTVVNDINTAVKPLIEGSNWMAHDHMAQRKQTQIYQVFHVNEILNLLAREKPEMTAFEVNARLTLLQQILGPVFGLLEAEFLSVIVDVTLDIMAYADMLQQPPEDLRNTVNTKNAIDVIYEGPLARAQRNQEILAIQQSVADTGGLITMNPEIALMVDFDKMQRKLYEIRGTQDLLKSERQYSDDVNKMREQQNAEKAAALVGGGAEALGKAAPGIKVLREEAGGRAAA
jgi:hypothetical protein